jgi:outer membrane lipoprotein-sorting protein
MFRSSLGALALALAVASSASAQTVDELIAKNLAAKGGKDKIKSVQTMRITGKMMMGAGMEAPFTLTTKRPKAMRMEFTIQGLTGVQAYDGTNAWMVMPFMGKKDPEQMTAEDTKELDDQADFDGPLMDYQAKGHTVELVGKEQVEGADAYKLKVTFKNGNIRYVWLDAETDLEIKTEGKRTMRGTEVEYESSIGDYKEVNGLMFAHSLEQSAKGAAAGQSQKMVFEKIELNPALADTLFLMPATAKKPEPPKADPAKADPTKVAETGLAEGGAGGEAKPADANATEAAPAAEKTVVSAAGDSVKATAKSAKSPKKKKK